MDLIQERAKLNAELEKGTADLTALSAKCTLLKAKIRKLDKAIESNKELIRELNADTQEKEGNAPGQAKAE